MSEEMTDHDLAAEIRASVRELCRYMNEAKARGLTVSFNIGEAAVISDGKEIGKEFIDTVSITRVKVEVL